MGRKYSKRQRKLLQSTYLIGAVMWILVTYALGTYKANSIIGYFILAFPLVIYALGFLNSGKESKVIKKGLLGNDFLVIGILFISVLFEINHTNTHHYTINIIIVAFFLLILSATDVITGRRGQSVSCHLRSIARTAAISLLAFVIWVNISQKVPMKSITRHACDDIHYGSNRPHIAKEMVFLSGAD